MRRVTTTTVTLVLFLLLSWQCHAQWPLNVITSLTSNDPMYHGLEKFKQEVEARSQGQITVRIFVGSQLGNDTDILEQARAGANVAVLVDGARLAVYADELGILGAPYLTSGFDEVRLLVTSDLFREWETTLREKSGYQILSFNWWQGERHLLTNKPIYLPQDLAGVRMRTPGAPVWLETIRAMGATPTPLAWSEVYSGLQQDVIDGAEAQHPATYNARLYEVISNVTLTGHINLITGLVCSSRWFDKLPQELQTIVRESALGAGDYASRLTEAQLADLEQQLIDAGVAVNKIDTAPFIEATKSTYEKLGYTQLRNKVESILHSAKQ